MPYSEYAAQGMTSPGYSTRTRRWLPIPGSRTPAHIDENLDAARIDLHADTLEAVDRLLAAAAPAGGVLL